MAQECIKGVKLAVSWKKNIEREIGDLNEESFPERAQKTGLRLTQTSIQNGISHYINEHRKREITLLQLT